MRVKAFLWLMHAVIGNYLQCFAQALDERRLVLMLDENAVVTEAKSDSPASLFNCDPNLLIGKPAYTFLDVLRPPGAHAMRCYWKRHSA
jgi:hypothetical protein